MIPLTQEQQLLVSSVDELARSEFAEAAFEWDGVPWPNVEHLADLGFLGVNVAEQYGGGGMAEVDAILVVEAVGTVCPDTAEWLYKQQLVGPRTVDMFGSEAAKQRYLPPVMAGEDGLAVAISEPQAGSDIAAMRTSVEEDGGELRLTGEKIWVSNVVDSSAAVVWVRFPEGLGSVIIEFDWPGVEIDQHYSNMAGHQQTQFRMVDVAVPEENVLVRGEEAFKRQLGALNWERLGSAALSNAWSRCALEHALDYVESREQFGQPIGDFQGVEWKLADAVKHLEASRALTFRAATAAEQRGGPPDRLEAALAKLYASEAVEQVTSESLQLHGANGYQRGHPLEYLYRLARGRRLAAGTDEVQKNQIAAVLKERGLPGFD